MASTIRVLQIEDNPADTRLIRQLVTEVSSIGFTWGNFDRLGAATDRSLFSEYLLQEGGDDEKNLFDKAIVDNTMDALNFFTILINLNQLTNLACSSRRPRRRGRHLVHKPVR